MCFSVAVVKLHHSHWYKLHNFQTESEKEGFPG